MTVAMISLDTNAPRIGGANRTATAVVMVPAALRRAAPRPTTSRLVRVRAAADRALTAPMPSAPMPRMVDPARVASLNSIPPASILDCWRRRDGLDPGRSWRAAGAALQVGDGTARGWDRARGLQPAGYRSPSPRPARPPDRRARRAHAGPGPPALVPAAQPDRPAQVHPPPADRRERSHLRLHALPRGHGRARRPRQDQWHRPRPRAQLVVTTQATPGAAGRHAAHTTTLPAAHADSGGDGAVVERPAPALWSAPRC